MLAKLNNEQINGLKLWWYLVGCYIWPIEIFASTKYLQLAITRWDFFFECFWFSFLTIMCASLYRIKLYPFYLCLCWNFIKDHGWAYILSNLSMNQLIDLLIYLWSIDLSIGPSIGLSIDRSGPSIHQSIYGSIHSSIHPSPSYLCVRDYLVKYVNEIIHAPSFVYIHPSIHHYPICMCEFLWSNTWMKSSIDHPVSVSISIHPSIHPSSPYVCEFIWSNTWMKL